MGSFGDGGWSDGEDGPAIPSAPQAQVEEVKLAVEAKKPTKLEKETWLAEPIDCDGEDEQWDQDIYTLKLGGTAILPNGVERVSTCTNCQWPMYLLTQVHAPWGEHVNRFLYVYCCNNSACMGKNGIVATRCVAPSPDSFAPVRSEAAYAPVFLDCFLEPEGPVKQDAQDLAKYQELAKSTVVEVDHEEKYEKQSPLDASFRKFVKRMKRCPSQCVRWSHGGDPLCVNSREPIPRPPPCERCGSERIFELQILPTSLYFVKPYNYPSKPKEQEQQTEESGASLQFGALRDVVDQFDRCLNFGSVFVFTCSGDCKDSGPEFVYVQSEADRG